MYSYPEQQNAPAASQVHFQRVILDEGHSIGGSDTTNKHRMATKLLAERRWVMTGE